MSNAEISQIIDSVCGGGGKYKILFVDNQRHRSVGGCRMSACYLLSYTLKVVHIDEFNLKAGKLRNKEALRF